MRAPSGIGANADREARDSIPGLDPDDLLAGAGLDIFDGFLTCTESKSTCKGKR